MAIITLSRGMFGGVEALAEQLSERLGYRLLTREEVLAQTAAVFGLSESQLQSALKHKPGLFEGRGLKKLHFVNCARAAITKAVQSDNVVYHGESGHLLLKAVPHVLRVRVMADMEYRVATAMERCNLNREKAIEYVRNADRERDNWMEWVHGVDADDPYTYDLVVNLARISVSTATTILADAAEREFQTTPQSQKIMNDLVLASEIQARLGLDRGVSDDRIDVAVDDGVVTISANVRHLADVERASELVQQMSGVTEVRSDIGTKWRE